MALIKIARKSSRTGVEKGGGMPLRHAHLDRETLRSLGLPNDVIDRTYRALYVYSVGAQNVIRDVYRNCHLADKPGRAKFSACIWMVFLYLLEHCEESEHTYTHMLHHVRAKRFQWYLAVNSRHSNIFITMLCCHVGLLFVCF